MLTKEVVNAKIEILNKHGLMSKEMDEEIAKIRDAYLEVKKELKKDKETSIQKVSNEFDKMVKEAQQIQLEKINSLLESIAEPKNIQPILGTLKPYTPTEVPMYIVFNLTFGDNE